MVFRVCLLYLLHYICKICSCTSEKLMYFAVTRFEKYYDLKNLFSLFSFSALIFELTHHVIRFHLKALQVASAGFYPVLSGKPPTSKGPHQMLFNRAEH